MYQTWTSGNTASVHLESLQGLTGMVGETHTVKTDILIEPEVKGSEQLYKAEMAASHFLQVQVKSQVISLQVQVKSQVISLQVQVKSQVIWSDVKSSHKSFGPNTSQVTSLFVQVQVKSHIILSSCNTQSGPGIKSIYNELQSKI